MVFVFTVTVSSIRQPRSAQRVLLSAGVSRATSSHLDTRHLGYKEEVKASCSRDESSSKSSPEILLVVPLFKFNLVFAFVTADV